MNIRHTRAICLVPTLFLCLLAGTVQAKVVPCKSLPQYVREAERSFAYCIAVADPIAQCGRADLDVREFGNAEDRLPRAGKGQQYYEARARRHDGAPAGTYRLVYLVTHGTAKQVIDARYYSADHYDSFCVL